MLHNSISWVVAVVVGSFIVFSSLLFSGCGIDTTVDAEEVEDVGNNVPTVIYVKTTSELGLYDPENIRGIALVVASVWEKVFNIDVTDASLECIVGINVYIISREEMTRRYGPLAEGHITDKIEVVANVNENDFTSIIAHELTHKAGECMNRDADNLHKNSKIFTCAGSVEKLSFEDLGVSYESNYECALDIAK